MNIEIMRNTLYKSYLDDFAAFCGRLGGTTGEVMGSMLSFEASCARFPAHCQRTAQLTTMHAADSCALGGTLVAAVVFSPCEKRC